MTEETTLATQDQAPTEAGNQPTAEAPATTAAPEGQEAAPTTEATTEQASYEFSAPDGYTIDEGLKTEFVGLAKELNIAPKDAQRLADLSVKLQQKQAEDFVNTQVGWVDSIKTDKEFGGEAMQENLGVARKALDAFGTPELKSLLDQTGFGNHPEIVKAFWRIGKQMSEDSKIVTGRQSAPTDKAKTMFPSMN